MKALIANALLPRLGVYIGPSPYAERLGHWKTPTAAHWVLMGLEVVIDRHPKG